MDGQNERERPKAIDGGNISKHGPTKDNRKGTGSEAEALVDTSHHSLVEQLQNSIFRDVVPSVDEKALVKKTILIFCDNIGDDSKETGDVRTSETHAVKTGRENKAANCQLCPARYRCSTGATVEILNIFKACRLRAARERASAKRWGS